MSDDPPRSADDGQPPEPPGKRGADRDWTADHRDKEAEAHDQASEARDERAEARDQRAEAREQASGRPDPGAASDRAGASSDRRRGATDRVRAAHDREAASVNRGQSATERETASIDELSGAYRREAGIVELEREIARAKRTKHPLVLAFVDVDGLKAINDSLGHAAGDELLRQVADTIRAHIRDYDLLVRVGGDEFVCGLPDMTTAGAAKRFLAVNARLTTTKDVSVSFGLAELEPDDSLDELLARADAALYSERESGPPGRGSA